MEYIKVRQTDLGYYVNGCWYDKALAGHIQGRIIFLNDSDKVIKYAYFDAFICDAFGAELRDALPLGVTKFTGPLEPGEIGYAYTNSLLNNHDAKEVFIDSVRIEYTDGTKVTLCVDELGNLGLSQEDLKQFRVKFKKVIAGYENKSCEELQELIDIVSKEFPFAFTNEFIENAQKIISTKKELEERERFEQQIVGYEGKDSKELTRLVAQVKATYSYSFINDFVTDAEKLITVKREEEQKIELRNLCMDIDAMDLANLEKLESKLKRYPSKLTKEYREHIGSRRDFLYAQMKREIATLMSGSDSLDVKKSRELLEKLSLYPDDLISDEKKKIITHIEKLQDVEWTKKCSQFGALPVESVRDLLNELLQSDVEANVQEKFTEIITTEINRLFQTEMTGICENVEDKPFFESDEILKAIEEFDVDISLKKPFYERVKEAVCSSYFAIYEKIIPYVLRVYGERIGTDKEIIPYQMNPVYEMEASQIITEKSSVYNYWEFPVITYYQPKLLSTYGYILTTERIYYLDGGITKSIELSEIQGYTGTKKLLGSILQVHLNNGQQISIPQKHGKNIEEIANVLACVTKEINNARKNVSYPDVFGRKSKMD